MADMRNRTPFYGAVPTSKLNADHVFMADGSNVENTIAALDSKIYVNEYAITEKQIGIYMGKPLYRIVVTGLTAPTTTGFKYITLSSLGLTDVDRVVNMGLDITHNNIVYRGPYYESASYFIINVWRETTKELVLSVGNGFVNNDMQVYFEYTKTTDTAIRSANRKKKTLTIEYKDFDMTKEREG